MDYRVFSMSSGEDENSTEAHVFARAYRGAWRAIYGSDPAGRHQVAALGFVMDFGARAPARSSTSHPRVPERHKRSQQRHDQARRSL